MSKDIEVTEKQNKFTSYLEWSDEGKSGIFRYIIGIILAVFTFFGLGGFLVIPLAVIKPDYENSLILKTAFTLAVFIVPFIFIPYIVKWIHKRPKWSVGLPKPQVEKWNFWVGFIVSTLVGIVALLLLAVAGMIDLSYVGFNWGTLIPLTIIGFFGIFIQAGAEEILFRGYITQFVRRLTKNKYIFLLIPAIIFSLPHAANISEYSGNIFVLTPYIISGLLYGWAAYKTGSLWMSIGLHLSNNLSGLVIAGVTADVLKTVAPIQFGTPGLGLTTLITGLQAILQVGIILWLLKRREVKA